MSQIFEVITIGGNRFRFEGDYLWQYGLQPGSMDILDKTVVEVLEDKDEGEIVAFFSQVVAVGKVDENTCLSMPREIIQAQCPKCGYIPK